MKDKAAKAAYDRARYAARYVDRRARICTAPWCSKEVTQPRRGYRLYCSQSCKYRHWYAQHEARLHPAALIDLPMAYVGDPIFEQARAATGIRGDTDEGNDALGEAVLAILEGRDPAEAARKYRAREAGLRIRNAHLENLEGLAIVGDRVIVEYQEAA